MTEIILRPQAEAQQRRKNNSCCQNVNLKTNWNPSAHHKSLHGCWTLFMQLQRSAQQETASTCRRRRRMKRRKKTGAPGFSFWHKISNNLSIRKQMMRWPTPTCNPFLQRREVAISNRAKRKSCLDLIWGRIFGKFSHFTKLKRDDGETNFFSHSQLGSRDFTWPAVKVFFSNPWLEAGPCLTLTWPSRQITKSFVRTQICRGPWKLQTI